MSRWSRYGSSRRTECRPNGNHGKPRGTPGKSPSGDHTGTAERNPLARTRVQLPRLPGKRGPLRPSGNPNTAGLAGDIAELRDRQPLPERRSNREHPRGAGSGSRATHRRTVPRNNRRRKWRKRRKLDHYRGCNRPEPRNRRLMQDEHHTRWSNRSGGPGRHLRLHHARHRP